MSSTDRDTKLDYKLANLLHGDHPIEGDHEELVVRLAELEVLHNAVYKAGWHRHTGDWDWGATITMSDGRKIGDAWAIELVLPPSMRREDFTACVDYDKIHLIHVEGLTWDEGKDGNVELNTDLPIRQVTNIYWEWR